MLNHTVLLLHFDLPRLRSTYGPFYVRHLLSQYSRDDAELVGGVHVPPQ